MPNVSSIEGVMMGEAQWASKHFENLKEHGFDSERCYIDLEKISITCKDLARYKKALRVKIRALMKTKERESLQECIEQFYTLAQFVRYLYGFHSCAVDVLSWQEQVALALQKEMAWELKPYVNGEWIAYESPQIYEQRLRSYYQEVTGSEVMDTLQCVQDAKPFLTLKDKAHFERWYGECNR